MKKQKFLLPVLALALVLVLASCSGGVPHDGECFVFEENEILDEVLLLFQERLPYAGQLE